MQNQNPNIPPINVDISKIPAQMCECGNKLFRPLYELRIISPLLLGQINKIPTVHFGQVFICDKCGKEFDLKPEQVPS